MIRKTVILGPDPTVVSPGAIWTLEAAGACPGAGCCKS